MEVDGQRRFGANGATDGDDGDDGGGEEVMWGVAAKRKGGVGSMCCAVLCCPAVLCHCG